MTGLQLIQSVLRIVTGGTEYDAAQAQDALSALNVLKDAWAAESFMQYDGVLESVTLVPSTSTYTVGPSGTLTTTRPVAITQLFVREGNVDYPIEIISASEFNEIADKTTTGNIPECAVVSNTFPNMTIQLWPVPDTANTLFIDSNKTFADFTLAGAISLPLPYLRAFKYNLAIDIWPEYSDKEPSANLVRQAHESKRLLKQININPVPQAVFDIPVQPRPYNIYSGV